MSNKKAMATTDKNLVQQITPKTNKKASLKKTMNENMTAVPQITQS